mmetsp:Transcript_66191/g.213369  ORF Transcript_66191/g.213369 Transcript_66191/m.213369 type:complete len:201 (-) Transcript_66191:984-1586(-)
MTCDAACRVMPAPPTPRVETMAPRPAKRWKSRTRRARSGPDSSPTRVCALTPNLDAMWEASMSMVFRYWQKMTTFPDWAKICSRSTSKSAVLPDACTSSGGAASSLSSGHFSKSRLLGWLQTCRSACMMRKTLPALVNFSWPVGTAGAPFWLASTEGSTCWVCSGRWKSSGKVWPRSSAREAALCSPPANAVMDAARMRL